MDLLGAYPVDGSTSFAIDPQDAVRLIEGAQSYGAQLDNDLGHLSHQLIDWEIPAVMAAGADEGEAGLPGSPSNGMRCQHSRSCCQL
jgi:hypothetical protein